MSNFIINECPVCSSTDFIPVGSVIDRMVSQESFNLIKCNGCGLIVTNNIPSEEHISPYYKAEAYISHSDTRQGLMNRLYHQARKIMLRRKEKLFDQLPIKSKKLLDIGAGTGYFPHYMEQHGWQVSAIEPDEEARLFMRKKFGIAAAPSSSLYNMPEKSFAVISMWHVLEHVYALDKYLKTIHKLLRTDGYLVLALPNSDSFDARKQGLDWSAWDVPRHIWHFKPSVVEQLLAKHGFKLESKKQMPFDGFYNSIKSYVNKGDKLAFIKGSIIGILAFFTGIFNRDKASSVIYVAKKMDSINEESGET